jgi:YD repeat-containing protein
MSKKYRNKINLEQAFALQLGQENIRYKYDSKGRLILWIFSNGETIRFNYNNHLF